MLQKLALLSLAGQLYCDETATSTAEEVTAVNNAVANDVADDKKVNTGEVDPHAELKAKIVANFNNLVDTKEVKFRFKKVVDEATKLESKRPDVELILPIPSIEGIVAIFEKGGKELELLYEVISDTVIARARELVNEKEDINQDNFPMEKLSWEAIANMPKAERRGGGIAKEVWEDFGKDYLEVMPAVTGKKQENIENAVKILLAKFNPVKTNKPVIKLLKEQIALYVTNSPNAEQYDECVKFLIEKADNLLNIDEAALLANL